MFACRSGFTNNREVPAQKNNGGREAPVMCCVVRLLDYLNAYRIEPYTKRARAS